MSHMAGDEAGNPVEFEHVAGSACCLDHAFDADGVDACKSYCAERQECGSFLFAPGENGKGRVFMRIFWLKLKFKPSSSL